MPKLNTNPPITPKSVDLPSTPSTPASKPLTNVGTIDATGGAPPIDTSGITGPTAIQKTSLSSIPEAFPIDALSKIDGKGLSGTTFMLDAGSLRGLKLQIRRVKDGDQPGFELVFQITEDKLKGMLDRFKEKSAKPTGVTFRATALGEDGVAKFQATTATISGGASHSPPDLDSNATAWGLALDDAKGAKIELVHDKAALAIRGLVRVQLRGDDKTCTDQLKSLTKSLGLHHLFAPPTPKSKQIHTLMRALWQVDHAAAKSFAAEDLDKLKPADLEAALESKGFDAARIAALHTAEVFPGHFTVIDPGQAKAMVEAGARYLYSTVTSPEHVASILEGGQKSSVQRYKDGLIINGMSTNADFVTGGGVGVFTRLVTQNAIYNDGGWAGRTYKLIQNHSQLARTDWHGWDGDFYGRRWNLETQTNFGVDLVNRVNAGGGYKDYNEIIFPAGNRPENIDRVVATNENDRQTLIAHLKSKGYQPHNGLSLEEFVVMSPKFMAFGPSPFADVKDLAAFGKDALEKAKNGELGALQWLLYEGPMGPARADVERAILLEGPKPAEDLVIRAAKRTGAFAMSTAQLDEVISKLTTDNKTATLQRLPTECAEALFRSGSELAYERLAQNKPPLNSWGAPYGITDDGFVRIYQELAAKQKPGQPRSKAFELALEVRAEALLNSGHAGFKAFLEKSPLVAPADPAAWIGEKIASIKGGGAGKGELALFSAQLTDKAAIADLQRRLIEADSSKTLELLSSSMALNGNQLHVPASALAPALEALPDGSQTKSVVLSSAAALLKLADAKLLELLEKKQGSYGSGFGIYGPEWAKVLEAQLAVTGGVVTDVVKKTLEHGSSELVALPEFKAILPKLGALYDVGADPKAFALDAAQKYGAGGALKLAYMVLGEQSAATRLPALGAILRASDYQVQYLLSYLQDPPGTFPASPAELRALVEELTKDPADANAMNKLAQNAGKALLLAADGPTLERLEKHFSSNDGALSQLGLHGASVTALLGELEGKGGDADKVKAFVLKAGAAQLIQGNDAGFLQYLSSKKLGYAAIGKDAAWAAQTFKGTVDQQAYYWGSGYYNSYPDYQKLPAGTEFLLKGAGAYDEALLAEIEKSIKGWGWSQMVLDKLIELTPDMPAAWKAKLTAAHKGS